MPLSRLARWLMRHPRAQKPVPRRAALRCEALEDRTNPVVVTVTAIDAVAAEAVGGGTSAVLEFRRGGDLSIPVDVAFTAGGTATRDIDYAGLPATGWVTIPAWRPFLRVPVAAVDDALREGTETLAVSVAAGGGVEPGGGPATVTIADNEPPPGPQTVWVDGDPDLLAQELDHTHLQDLNNEASILLRRSDPAGELALSYSLVGTATRGVDYADPGVVRFADGSLTTRVTIAPANVDDVKEGTETVAFTLNSGAGYQVQGAAAFTIELFDGTPGAVNDDIQPKFEVGFGVGNAAGDIGGSSADAVASESGKSAFFVISYFDVYAMVFDPDACHVWPRNYKLGGTARENVDYTVEVVSTPPTTADWESRFGRYKIIIHPINDAIYEGSETVEIAVDPSTADVIDFWDNPPFTITLRDNDPPRVHVEALDPQAAEAGGSGLFRVVREGPLDKAVTVNYAFGGAAAYAKDYGATLAQTGTLTFGAGEKYAEVRVAGLADNRVEGAEDVTFGLLPGPDYTVEGGAAGVTIADDPPQVAVFGGADAREAGLVNGAFLFRRWGGDLAEALLAAYSALSSSTADLLDYEELPGAVWFLGGFDYVSVPLVPKGDDLIENPDEYVEVGVDGPPSPWSQTLVKIIDAPAIHSVWWAPNVNPQFGQPLAANTNPGGGVAIFPERHTLADQVSRTAIDIVVTLTRPLEGVTVRLFIYDVDDPSSNLAPDSDANRVLDDESKSADNRDAGHPSFSGQVIEKTTNEFGVARFVFLGGISRKPGDNYRAVATVDTSIDLATEVEAIQRDGVRAGLRRKIGGDVVPVGGPALTAASDLLTVWRTLHVERDHMAAPTVFDGPFGGGQVDDAFPGGPIPDPTIAHLTSSMVPAYVRVADDLAAHNKNQVGPFVHNLKDGDALAYGNAGRDVPSETGFWVVQIIGAYEGPVQSDLDDDNILPSNALYGLAAGSLGAQYTQGPVLIYTEVCRDGAVTGRDSGYVAEGVIVQRVVTHEVLHYFGATHPLGGIMDADTALKGTDAENVLLPVHLNVVRTQQGWGHP